MDMTEWLKTKESQPVKPYTNGSVKHQIKQVKQTYSRQATLMLFSVTVLP
jgi:hypothetical protein